MVAITKAILLAAISGSALAQDNVMEKRNAQIDSLMRGIQQINTQRLQHTGAPPALMKAGSLGPRNAAAAAAVAAGAGTTQGIYDQQAAAIAKQLVDALNAKQKMTKSGDVTGLIKARNAEAEAASPGAGAVQGVWDQQLTAAAKQAVNAANARQKMQKGGDAIGLIKRAAVAFTA